MRKPGYLRRHNLNGERGILVGIIGQAQSDFFFGSPEERRAAAAFLGQSMIPGSWYRHILSSLDFSDDSILPLGISKQEILEMMREQSAADVLVETVSGVARENDIPFYEALNLVAQASPELVTAYQASIRADSKKSRTYQDQKIARLKSDIAAAELEIRAERYHNGDYLQAVEWARIHSPHLLQKAMRR